MDSMQSLIEIGSGSVVSAAAVAGGKATMGLAT